MMIFDSGLLFWAILYINSITIIIIIIRYNRAFCVAGPVAWNGLPLHIRSAPTL